MPASPERDSFIGNAIGYGRDGAEQCTERNGIGRTKLYECASVLYREFHYLYKRFRMDYGPDSQCDGAGDDDPIV